MSWTSFVYIISMAATVAFTVTAILAIRRESDIDILGAIVLGTITAIGGGTIRDVILAVPVFWASDLSYIWVAVGASVAALYGRRLFSDRYVYELLLYLDGFGAAMFSIAATGKVWDLDFGLPVAPVVLGLISAIGGGLIRDVLADRTTLLYNPALRIKL